MIYNLTIALFGLLCLSYYLNDKEFLAPSFLFTVSFLFACCWFIPYNDIWSGIQQNTCFVIGGGVAVFIFVSWFIKILFRLKNKKNLKPEVVSLTEINIVLWVKIFFIIFEVFTIFIKVYFIVKTVGGNLSDFTTALFQYRRMNMFTDDYVEKLPRWINLCSLIVTCGGYWFGYVLCNNYIVKKKLDIHLIAICLLAIVFSFTGAGRGSAVQYILAVVVYYFLLAKKIRFKFNLFFKCILCFAVFLFFFQKSLVLLGRESNEDPLYYLAEYCGAQLKNLDLFLIETHGFAVGGFNQTFFSLNKWIGTRLGWLGMPNFLDLPFRSINGHNLGNEVTTFRPFIYDYGYKGVVFCTALIALISQVTYEYTRKIKRKPTIGVLLYGYMVFGLLMSYFTSTFCLNVFSISFIYNIILYEIFNLIFVRLSWSKN